MLSMVEVSPAEQMGTKGVEAEMSLRGMRGM